MYAQLGGLRFERTQYFTGTERTQGFSYAEHAMLAGKPHLEATGGALEEFSIDMRFHVLWCNPAAVKAKLDEVAARQQALALVYGDGTYRGKFVITQIGETKLHDDPQGRPYCLDVKVSLREFIDVAPLETARTQQKAAAPARRVAGKSRRGVHHGAPTFTVITQTNPDGFSVQKIVRKQ